MIGICVCVCVCGVVPEGAPGILRDKTMDDNLIYIPNDDTQNYHFCR